MIWARLKRVLGISWEASMHLEPRRLLLPGALCLALAGSLLYHLTGSVDETVDPNPELSARERQSALRVADDLIIASASFATERGLALAALSASGPIGLAQQNALHERRTLADEAMARVETHLRLLPSTIVLDRIVARITVAYEKMTLQRSEVDGEAAKSASDRAVHAVSRSFEMPTTLISGLQELLRAIHLDLKVSNQGAATCLEIQRLLLEMAEHAGRERAQIAIFLTAAGRVARAQLTLAEHNRHQATLIWTQVQSALASLAPRLSLIEQARVVEQRYFSSHDRTRRLLLATSHDSAVALTMSEWFQHATFAIDAMVEFSRRAGTVAAEDFGKAM
jgi:hypothetical protein